MRIAFCNFRVLQVFNFQNKRKMTSFPKVYVRHVESEDKMKINFTYGTESIPDRNFTFLRNKDETLEVTISRMKLKISENLNRQPKKKKKNSQVTPTQEPISVSLSLLRNNEALDINFKNVEVWNPTVQMKLNNVTYEICENPPAVVHLSLPRNIMAGYPVYPSVSLEFCSKDDCVFSWYRTLNESEKQINSNNEHFINCRGKYWLKIADGFFCILSEAHAGCYLRVTCFPKNGDKDGVVEEALGLNSVQLGPKKCPFEDRHQYTKEITQSGRMRCMSYNILADLYADSDTARNILFPYCPAEVLSVDYRKQLYLKEIIGYNSDLICLQEVDRKVFKDDLIPVLSSTGLTGIYDEKGGQVVEGLACFYQTSKFKIIESHAIILCDAIKTEPVLQPLFLKMNENEKLMERFMNRTTALQVVLLETTDIPQKRILVGNTHLYFHPESDNIRLMQGAACILYLESLLLKFRQKDPTYQTSFILCGDFNSCPEFGFYKLVTQGSLSKDCMDWKSNPEEEVSGLALHHSLSLKSACGTPEYTNYTEAFYGCLDYVFYDESLLKVCDIVPHPTHEQVIEHVALPNKVFPSDHIAQICTLEWK